MTKFSANLGFLWNELSLPDAIRAAKRAGFDAVECHWPYDVPAPLVKAALDEAGLTMLGLNTVRGDLAAGENGMAALVGRDKDAQMAIDEAIAYAAVLGTPNIHVMAGFAQGDDAHATFVRNLNYACDAAKHHDITILIEPLNHYDAPGYFLQTTTQARGIIEDVGASNLKLMFDCYHVQLMEGDLTNRLAACQDIIGHIQFASVPDRGTPDHGEVNYHHIFDVIESLPYDKPLGAEYKPVGGDTEASLVWLQNR